jgi:hypothetical protein
MHDRRPDHRPGKEGDRVHVVVLLDHVDRAGRWRRAVVVVMDHRGSRAMHHVAGLLVDYHRTMRMTVALAIGMAASMVVAPVGERGGGDGESSSKDRKLLQHLGLLSG